MAPRYVTERIHTPESLIKDRHIYRERGVTFFKEELLEPFSGVLTVTVVSAKDLPNRDRKIADASDPYVEVATGFSFSITESIYDDLNPVWKANNVFDLLVMFDDVGNAQADDWNKIKVKVVDTDMDREGKKTPGWYAMAKYAMQGMDDLLGQGEIVLTPAQIDELKNGGQITSVVKLRSADYSGGEVTLGLTYKRFQGSTTNGKGGGPKKSDWLDFNRAKEAIASEDTEDISFGAAWDSVIKDFKKPDDDDLVFEKVAYVDHVESDTQCWISRNVAKKEIVLAFRASIEDQDWLVNLTYQLSDIPGFPGNQEKPIKVHNGFLATWKSVERPVFAILDLLTAGDPSWRVHVSGFSLGAAMAAVSAFFVAKHADGRYAVDMLSFAGPRVGNAAFAKEWGQTLAGVRVYNPIDLVPHVPFRLSTEEIKKPSLLETLRGLPDRFLNAVTDIDYCHLDCTTLRLSPDGKHELIEEYVDEGESVKSLKALRDAQNFTQIQKDERTNKEVEVKVSRKTHAEPTHREMLRAMVKLPNAPRFLGE